MAWREELGAGATVGAEGDGARESAFCGLRLKCVKVADGGRHPQPGDLTQTLLCPGLQGSCPGPTGSVPAAPLLVWITQPGGSHCAPGPGWAGAAPLSRAYERLLLLSPGRCGRGVGGLHSESCWWLCLKD